MSKNPIKKEECNCYSLYKCIYCNKDIDIRMQPWDYLFPINMFHLGCKISHQKEQENSVDFLAKGKGSLIPKQEQECKHECLIKKIHEGDKSESIECPHCLEVFTRTFPPIVSKPVPKEDWKERFDRKFEVTDWKNTMEVFPCEGGYCSTSVKEIKSFISDLLDKERERLIEIYTVALALDRDEYRQSLLEKIEEGCVDERGKGNDYDKIISLKSLKDIINIIKSYE